ncbi:MAG: 30S ribosomal protein S18 [Candidatus Portnoybacteria bacterium]|nr:30S ribosomal protein S18 [Candidatus Portnoybacteria bacterium]
MFPRRPQQPVEKKQCYFCQQNINSIDYKNVELLRQFVSGQAKIFATRRTGTCRKHQRILSNAIKRARFLALIPFARK